MAWPKEVKDEVFVKCGRHCCICHKFCGTKMELHHIKLKSEGGDESLENCIPLCFDCHSDQKSYDFKHPKGTKYTESELKRHRDKWYSLASQNLGTGTSDHLNQDQQFFYRIVSKVKPKPTIWYLQQLDFEIRKFNLKNLDPIFSVNFEYAHEPWMEFFDSDIQAIWLELKGKFVEFEEMINTYTFSFKDGSYENQCVPREWEEEGPRQQLERYKMGTSTLNKLGDEIVECYSRFISLSRKKLGVVMGPSET